MIKYLYKYQYVKQINDSTELNWNERTEKDSFDLSSFFTRPPQ